MEDWTTTWPTPAEVTARMSTGRSRGALRWFYGYTSAPATYRKEQPELRIARLAIMANGKVIATEGDFLCANETHILWGPWVQPPPAPPERRLEDTGLTAWNVSDGYGKDKKTRKVWAKEKPKGWDTEPHDWGSK